eukprot:gene4637-93_t
MAEDQAEIEEEILNVCAIFPDVVSRIGDRSMYITVVHPSGYSSDTHIQLPQAYPQLPPVIIKCNSSNSTSKPSHSLPHGQLSNSLFSEVSSFLSSNFQPEDLVLYQLVEYIIATWHNLVELNECRDTLCLSSIHEDSRTLSKEQQRTFIRRCLIHIDHVHSQKMYFQFLQKRAAAMDIVLHITICGPLILVGAVAKSSNITELLKQMRTQCIDVDRRKRRCKERMSRVILDEDSIDSEKCPVWQQHGSSEQFSVMKCDSRTDLIDEKCFSPFIWLLKRKEYCEKLFSCST